MHQKFVSAFFMNDMGAYLREFNKAGPLMKYWLGSQTAGFCAGFAKGFSECQYTKSPTIVERTGNGVVVGIGCAGLALTTPFLLIHAAECAIRGKDNKVFGFYKRMSKGL